MRLLTILLSFLLFFTISLAQDVSNLVLNQSIEKQIKGGETHSFSVQLSPNQTARIEVEQKGVDVSLAGYKPNGERFVEMESPSGLLGNDWILLTADEVGNYKIEVQPADAKSNLGKYLIKLTEIRPTIEDDRKVIEVSKQITKLADETTTLRTNGTQAGRRKAIEKWNEVITLSKIKKDKVWEVVAILTKGLLNEQLGELQKALENYQITLNLSREIGNKQYEATSLNNLGNSYNLLGDYQLAIFYLNQSVVLQREIGNKRGESFNLNNLGMSNLLLENYQDAKSFFEQALVLRREIKEPRLVAVTLNNLGLVSIKIGDNAKALEFFQESLEIRKTISDKQGEANSNLNLGKLFWKSNDKTKAFESFTNSNILAKTIGDRRAEADSSYWLAIAENDKGNLNKAIENIENCLQIIEQIRGEILSPETRIAYFSTVQQYFELYTELLVSRSETDKNQSDIFNALEASERARTRSFVELLQEARINFKQGVNENLLDKEREIQDSLNAKYRQRTTLLNGKNTPEQISKINNEINDLNISLNNLQTEMRQANPRYANLKNAEPLNVSEMQKLLDDETILLEYKLGEKRSFAWLISKDSVKFFNLPPRKEIEPLAKDFYNLLISRKKENEPKIAESAQKLNEIIFQIPTANLQNKRLAIVADEILQYIPFAVFSDKNEIVNLPSVNVLAEIRRNQNIKLPKKTLVVFADPIFDLDDSRIAEKQKDSTPNAEIKQVLRDFNLGDKLPRLLASREEARNISSFLPKEKVLVNMDFAANRENTLSENLSDYQILHFATHGLLDNSRPEFSGLVLSLYDQKGKTQDGFLRLNQIYNLNLNSDLVVLSACQTALGKDVRGEGLIGLTRGFMYAGAKRIVASLWKVDDAATAEFMKRFYQNLLVKKLKPSSALRQTQNELKQIPRFKSPYFWAGFTIQGDWK
jgi:CHAT domain-containing protein/Tfp pilus assembly protein PilF